MAASGAALEDLDMVWLGLDLGATNAKAAVVDEAGTVLAYRWAPLAAGPQQQQQRSRSRPQFSAASSLAAAAVVAQLVACAEGALAACGVAWGRVAGVGVGTPGAVEDGEVVAAGNLFQGHRRVPLERLVREAVGDRPVALLNDADAALRAELWVGAARGARHAAMLTLGTGAGCAVAVDGRVLAGTEGGHMIVDANDATARPCPCGSRGCLEAHASASAIALDYEARKRRPRRRRHIAREQQQQQPPDEPPEEGEEEFKCGCEDVFALAETDPVARAVVDDAARAVAVAAVNLLRLLNPDVVVIAGGVAGAGAPFLDAVRSHAKALAWTCLPFDEAAIVLAAAGPHTGCIGAASYARANHHGDPPSSPPRLDERSVCFDEACGGFWRRRREDSSSSSCDGGLSLCVLS